MIAGQAVTGRDESGIHNKRETKLLHSPSSLKMLRWITVIPLSHHREHAILSDIRWEIMSLLFIMQRFVDFFINFITYYIFYIITNLRGVDLTIHIHM